MKTYHFFWIALIFFFSPSSAFLQRNVIEISKQPHGTLIVTAICEDGILIASDSRASFTIGQGESQKVYAYIDNQQKIFTLGKFKLGVSGLSMLNKKYIHDIVKMYNKAYKPSHNIDSTFNTFLKFLRTKINVPDSSIFAENQFFLAGYEDSIPVTLAVSSDKYIKKNNVESLIYSDSNFYGYLRVAKDFDLTCENVAPILESAINNFATNKGNYMIGGPLNIIQIKSDNSFVEIKSFKTKKFKTYKRFAKAIIKGRLKVKYLYSDSSELLKKTLIEGIEEGY